MSQRKMKKEIKSDHFRQKVRYLKFEFTFKAICGKEGGILKIAKNI